MKKESRREGVRRKERKIEEEKGEKEGCKTRV